MIPAPAVSTTASCSYAQIPCCLCATLIYPNGANQCATCLAQQIDLKDVLQRGPGGSPYSIVYQCRQCRRYNARTDKHYVNCELESPELLALCLKRIPALHHNNNKTASSTSSCTTTTSSEPILSHKIHLVDANFIWTEPNCMRLKLHLTVRCEMTGGSGGGGSSAANNSVHVQQRVMIEQHVQFKMCPECNREYTNRTWHAVVQLRQKRSVGTTSTDSSAPKKGLVALELALARNSNVRKRVMKIDNYRNGFDFYFLSLQHALSFTNYLQKVSPMKVKTSQKLVSSDTKNNTANLKHTVNCDMVPICRDDLILIHKSATKCKLSGRIALVTKVTSVLHLIDASPPTPTPTGGSSSSTKQHQRGKNNNNKAVNNNNINNNSSSNVINNIQMELSPESYYRNEKLYTLLHASNRLVRFVVLDVELLAQGNNNSNNTTTTEEQDDDDQPTLLYKGPQSGIDKYALADVEVVRESDFGVNDDADAYHRVTSHLGHLLSPGDTVLGYDLTNDVCHGIVDDDILNDSLRNSYIVPDIVLVKKVSGDKHNNNNNKKLEEKKDAVTPTYENEVDDGADSTTNTKRLSKKKQRRQKRQEGKRRRALEESAARMGFMDDDAEYYDHAQQEQDDREPEGQGAQEEPDAELQAEVAALEREFSQLAAADAGAEDEDREGKVECR